MTTIRNNDANWPARLGGDIGEALVHISAPAYLLDPNGVVLWENLRALDVFGDLRGSHFTVLVAPEFLERSRLAFAKKVIGKARTTDHETALRTRSGDAVPVELRAVTVRDGNRVVGIFGIVEFAAQPQGGQRPPVAVTPRQHEVLRLLARGQSTTQIAETLGVARETVRNHVRGLLQALGVSSRLAAIAEARRLGLID